MTAWKQQHRKQPLNTVPPYECSCDMVQKRLPSTKQWKQNVKEVKERVGAAGVPSEERRVSPIVELSLLLVWLIMPSILTHLLDRMTG